MSGEPINSVFYQCDIVVLCLNPQLFYNAGHMAYNDIVKQTMEALWEGFNMQQKISKNISCFRQNQTMTQEEFAARLGVTPQAVSKWERGTSIPDITLIPDICRLLNVPSDMLLGIEEMSLSENKSMAEEREIKQNLIAEPLRIEVGTGLIPCIVEGLETDYVHQRRRRLAVETGMLLPILRILDNVEYAENEVRIRSYDKVLLQREFAEANMQTYQTIIDEAVRLCRENYVSILNKNLVKSMMDNLQEQYPGVLDGLVPDRAGYREVVQYLRKIIAERGNLRDLIHIMEELESMETI